MRTASIRSFFSLVLLGATMACLAVAQNTNSTERKYTPRIVGGAPMTSKGYGFTAYIIARESTTKGGLCTGFLITPTAVITAAHCIKPDTSTTYVASQFEVWFGLDAPTQAKSANGFKVSSIQWASDFTLTTMLNDIAILHLSSPVPESVATPTKIYTGPVYLDSPIFAAGFGRTKPNDPNSQPPSLMSVGLRLGSNSFCRANNPYFKTSSQLCTAYISGRDTCLGDSGGPLFTITDRDYPVGVLGITSMSTYPKNDPTAICARSDVTGYYTRLEYFLEMIAKSVGVSADSITISNSTVARPTDTQADADENTQDSNDKFIRSASRTGIRSSLPTATNDVTFSFSHYSMSLSFPNYTPKPSIGGVIEVNAASRRTAVSAILLIAAVALFL
ncbi:hypothetical protein FBU59_000127 [Linderina macrospora]|uniref:Uncharacterized protein n=1 Tax=Linderina macrospora TaxID=4868 RepID=A0ACC1JHP3_9FUNG|nr:hypothetical protein FBU59_000127 [Linderina macrospora]